jgi:hypothetical protein
VPTTQAGLPPAISQCLHKYAFFPSEPGTNIKPLLEGEFITVTGHLPSGTEFEYSTTEKEKKYLDKNINEEKLQEFAHNSLSVETIKRVIAALIVKRNSGQF